MTVKTILTAAAMAAVLAAPAMAQNSYGWNGDDGWNTSGGSSGGTQGFDTTYIGRLVADFLRRDGWNETDFQPTGWGEQSTDPRGVFY